MMIIQLCSVWQWVMEKMKACRPLQKVEQYSFCPILHPYCTHFAPFCTHFAPFCTHFAPYCTHFVTILHPFCTHIAAIFAPVSLASHLYGRTSTPGTCEPYVYRMATLATALKIIDGPNGFRQQQWWDRSWQCHFQIPSAGNTSGVGWPQWHGGKWKWYADKPQLQAHSS